MSGVNHLAKRWVEEGRSEDAADDLDYVAKTAWHLSTNPPVEDDGDDHGLVMMYLVDEGKTWITPLHYLDVQEGVEDGCKWARIRDVLLMPPED